MKKTKAGKDFSEMITDQYTNQGFETTTSSAKQETTKK